MTTWILVLKTYRLVSKYWESRCRSLLVSTARNELPAAEIADAHCSGMHWACCSGPRHLCSCLFDVHQMCQLSVWALKCPRSAATKSQQGKGIMLMPVSAWHKFDQFDSCMIACKVQVKSASPAQKSSSIEIIFVVDLSEFRCMSWSSSESRFWPGRHPVDFRWAVICGDQMAPWSERACKNTRLLML